MILLGDLLVAYFRRIEKMYISPTCSAKVMGLFVSFQRVSRITSLKIFSRNYYFLSAWYLATEANQSFFHRS